MNERTNTLLKAIDALLLKHRIIKGKIGIHTICCSFIYSRNYKRRLLLNSNGESMIVYSIDQNENVITDFPLDFIAELHFSLISLLYIKS